MRISFCALVTLFAIFQFSENTADPDLWGHITFGQEMLRSGSIPKTEIYSWTARGQPWINHEVLAEIALGAAHSWLGGIGVLLLKIVVGLATFVICLRLGAAGLTWPARYVVWALGALAVVEMSFGFAARPQIFTALFLALELALLRGIHAGSLRWAFALPVLFLVWINTHGGVLAGFGLLVLACLVTCGEFFIRKSREHETTETSCDEMKRGLVLWLATVASAAALLCNPWKAELLRWLVGSVFWLRPQIEEWNPAPVDWDHATFFVLLVITVFALVCSRQRRVGWEVAACAAFAVLALRSVRNTPLFCIVALALVPPHLANALGRFQVSLRRLIEFARRKNFQKTATVAFIVASVSIAVATLTLHKEHLLTMEVPRAEYPVAAVDFIRAHQLNGRLVVFFDWGEMAIFHLPDCPPSIDGRLDTCYSHQLITAHWKFYRDEPFDRAVFNPEKADLALLPSKLAGALLLDLKLGWEAVYFDDLAVVLVRDASHYPKLSGMKLPVQGAKSATLGRVAFPDKNPRWK